jgi:hypothetical protein
MTHVQTIDPVQRYTTAQLEAACSVAAWLRRGTFVLTTPGERGTG